MPKLLELDRNFDVILEELQAVMPRSAEIPLYQDAGFVQAEHGPG